MRFREIAPDDVPALFDVRVATRENRLSREELAARGITEPAVRARLSGSFRGWLCECDGRVAGFAMGDGATGELEVIAVLPEFEGRGAGRGLLRRVEDWLRSLGWHEVWLFTDPDPSLRAYRFYRAAGWRDDGVEGGNRVMRKATHEGPEDKSASPWLGIPADDYEGHMGSAGVDQLAALSGAFSEVYGRLRPARVAVLGCATGNGFEHIDVGMTRRLVGVDIHPGYLAVARRRHHRLAGILELQCRSVETCGMGAGSLDLLFAGLLFEYVEPGPLLERIASWLAAGATLVAVLQLPSAATPPVSPTAYESLGALAPVMRLVPPTEFRRIAERAGLTPVLEREIPLRGGKAFHETHLVRR